MNDLADLSAWLDLTQQAVLQLDPKNSVVEAFWKQGARSDGRVFGQARRYTVQHGVLLNNHSAGGSALVKCQNGSSVLAAVTLQIGQPAAAAPQQGDVVVTVTSTTNTTTNSIPQLQSFIQRILEENIDLEQLVITEGKLAYRLVVTLSLLEYDNCGNVMDACLAAAVAALLDTQLPVQPPSVIVDGVVYTDDDDNTDGIDRKPLRMPIVPCSLTAAGARFGIRQQQQGDTAATTTQLQHHHWIVDPDAEEEKVQESVVTVVVNAAAAAAAKDDVVLAVHFGPSCSCDPSSSSQASITTTELARIIHMAVGHAADLYSILQRP